MYRVPLPNNKLWGLLTARLFYRPHALPVTQRMVLKAQTEEPSERQYHRNCATFLSRSVNDQNTANEFWFNGSESEPMNVVTRFWNINSHLKSFLYLQIVLSRHYRSNKLCARPPQYAPAPCKLTIDFLTLKVVSESRVTWATSVPILVFLGLSVLNLGLMYATDRRQTDVRRTSSLNVHTLGAGHNN